MVGSRKSDSAPESHASSVMEETPPSLLGDRFRRYRTKQGISIRELAQAAGVSKNSIVRLEQGRGSHPSTLISLCEALNLHVDRLAGRAPKGDLVVAHTRKADNWHDHSDMASSPLSGTVARRRRGGLNMVNILQSRLPEGRLLPSVLELSEPTQSRSHVGEEFVYVLEGRLRLTVGSETFSLESGESLAFWSAEPHVYAPAPRSRLPVRILSVRVDGSTRAS